MANIVFTPTLMNAINAFNALNNDERATFASYVMAQNSVAHVQSAPSAIAEQTPSAPIVEAPKAEERTYTDTHVYCELSFDGKGVEFYVLKADGTHGSAFTYMQGVRALIGKELKLEWDKALVSKDTHHDDRNGHVYGEHKLGAYRLVDGKGKALTKAKVAEWAKAHGEFVLTAEGKAQYHADKDARKAKRLAKDAKVFARYGMELPNA